MRLHHNFVSWWADFLSNRQQCVRYAELVSSFQHLTCGGLKGNQDGSIMLFYPHQRPTEILFHWKYVDDSTVGTTIRNISPDCNPLQYILDRHTD